MTTVSRSHDIERFESSVRSHEISPELVLVDAELASVARASLALHAERPTSAAASPPKRVLVDPEPASVASASLALHEEKRTSAAASPPAAPLEPDAAVPLYYPVEAPRFFHSAAAQSDKRSRRGWDAIAATASHLVKLVMPALLFLSVLVNLALAGVLLAGADDTPHLDSSPVEPVSTPVGETPAVVQTNTRPSSAKTGRHRAPSKGRATAKARRARAQARALAKASAERTVLTLLQTLPKARIASLIDSSSGLLKNNVQAVCRRRSAKRVARFDCAVRVAGTPRGATVYVRYTVKPGGGWSVTWLGRPER